MNIQLAVLCDAAADYGGKLSVLGAFDTIVTKKLPAVHPQCSIALRIVFEPHEDGAHQLKMNLVDEDGAAIMPNIDIPIRVHMGEITSFLARNFVLNIQQLKFPKVGQYAFHVYWDGHHEKTIPLQVRMAPSPATAQS
jgi:hypothetical protein